MKKSRFTEQQIAFALQQAEGDTSVDEVCRKMGISQETFFRWKKVYGGLMLPEVRRLKQLEEENARLRKLVADLTLDKQQGLADLFGSVQFSFGSPGLADIVIQENPHQCIGIQALHVSASYRRRREAFVQACGARHKDRPGCVSSPA